MAYYFKLLSYLCNGKPSAVLYYNNHCIMNPTIVTLTTDWGYSDYYTGRVKGKLYSYIPGVQVVDITHGIPPYQIARATYVVKYACLGFPPGTIHIIDVCSSQTPEHPFVVVEHNEQYYICTDNGLPSAVFGSDKIKAVVIDKVNQETNSYTFAACDLFCKVAAMLANGAALEDIGFEADSLVTGAWMKPDFSQNPIEVHVVYVDGYGNCNLNITYDEFEQVRRNRDFEVLVHEVTVKKLYRSYVDGERQARPRSSLIITVSSLGNLQLAINGGNAAQYFNLEYMSTVKIKFL